MENVCQGQKVIVNCAKKKEQKLSVKEPQSES